MPFEHPYHSPESRSLKDSMHTSIDESLKIELDNIEYVRRAKKENVQRMRSSPPRINGVRQLHSNPLEF